MTARNSGRTAVAVVIAGLTLFGALLVWQTARDTPPDAQRLQPPSPEASVPIPEKSSSTNTPDGAAEDPSGDLEPRQIWRTATVDASENADKDAENDAVPPKVRDDLPATLMALDREALESLAAGDTARLAIGEDRSAVFSVTRVSVHQAYGVTSIRGNILASDITLPAVITVGDDSTLATVSTRDGIFELRGNETSAWLYRATDLGIPGGEVVDYIVPDRATPSTAQAVSSPDSPSTE